MDNVVYLFKPKKELTLVTNNIDIDVETTTINMMGAALVEAAKHGYNISTDKKFIVDYIVICRLVSASLNRSKNIKDEFQTFLDQIIKNNYEI